MIHLAQHKGLELGFCREITGSVKRRKYTDQLNDYELLKEVVPQRGLVERCRYTLRPIGCGEFADLQVFKRLLLHILR
jgi:hypothetical protein